MQLVGLLHRPGEGAWRGKEGFDRLERSTAGLGVEEVDDWDPEEIEAEEQEVSSVLIAISHNTSSEDCSLAVSDLRP